MTLIICDPGYVPTGLNPDGTAKPCAAEGTPEADAYWALVEEAKANVIPVQPDIEAGESIASSGEQPAGMLELAETGTADLALPGAIVAALTIAAFAALLARMVGAGSRRRAS